VSRIRAIRCEAPSVRRAAEVPARQNDARIARLTPIQNVSDIAQSFAWFETLGWKKLWDWGDPPGFGTVGSGACEIFLCQGARGGRGNGG
jgi:hypothetical protein